MCDTHLLDILLMRDALGGLIILGQVPFVFVFEALGSGAQWWLRVFTKLSRTIAKLCCSGLLRLGAFPMRKDTYAHRSAARALRDGSNK